MNALETTSLLVLDAALRGTPLLLLCWICTRLLRGRSARLRSALWLHGLLGLAAMPCLVDLMPGWQLDLWSEPLPQPKSSTGFVSAPKTFAHLLPALGAIWVGGTVLGLLRLGLGCASVELKRRRARLLDSTWDRRIELAAARLGVRARVYGTEEVRSPWLFGLWKPSILLPEECESWSDERAELVLLHELAHVRRRDWPVRLFSGAVRAVFWFHPLVWLAARRIELESERACDELVLESGASPARYARVLVDFADRPAARGGAAALGLGGRSDLERRVHSILNTRGFGGSGKRARGGAVLLSLSLTGTTALLLVLASLREQGVRAVSVEVQMAGKIELTDEGSDVRFVSERGFLSIERVTDEGTREQFDARALEDGGVERRLKVNGVERAIDGERDRVRELLREVEPRNR